MDDRQCSKVKKAIGMFEALVNPRNPDKFNSPSLHLMRNLEAPVLLFENQAMEVATLACSRSQWQLIESLLLVMGRMLGQCKCKCQ